MANQETAAPVNSDVSTNDTAPTTLVTDGDQQTPVTPPAEEATASPAEGEQNAPEGGQDGEEGTSEDSPVEGPPEKYEFQSPEGQTLDEGFVEAYSEAAREAGLSQEKAQALIDKVAPAIAKQQTERATALIDGWAEASKTDKEFGGEQFEANLSIAKTALQKFGSPQLTEFLNSTGMGNHPEFIRLFYQIGKAISEDSTFIDGQSADGKATPPKSFEAAANKLYPQKKESK